MRRTMTITASQSFEFRIAAEDAGRRLDEFLASRFGGLSRLRLAGLIKAGACTIDHATAPAVLHTVTPAGWRLNEGDTVTIAFDDTLPTAMEPEPVPLEVLYEDDQIVVVVKPAGMLVHPTKGIKRGTLVNALAYHLNRQFYAPADNPQSTIRNPQLEDPQSVIGQSAVPESAIRIPQSAIVSPVHGEPHTLIRPGLVHRLDRATSGVMVIAKTQAALSRLSRHFHRRLVKKRYLALIDGVLSEDSGEWNAPIARDRERQPHWWVTENGKPSVTNFIVKERFPHSTLVELEPVTGRTNQLRIHAAYFGHPILGDELYGPSGQSATRESAIPNPRSEMDSPVILDSAIRNPQSAIGRSAIGRSAISLCLHAWKLALHHPATGQWLEFVAPLPNGFAVLLESDTIVNS